MISYNTIKHTVANEDNTLIINIPKMSNAYTNFNYDDLTDENIDKYIFKIERVVRSSIEYKTWVNTLKDVYGLTQCVFFGNVGIGDKYNQLIRDIGGDDYFENEEKNSMKIEQHHYPFTLFDITGIVLRKRIACNESIDLYSCAHEIMLLHSAGLVGVVPLSITIHELYHNGLIFIPLTSVFGRYDIFINYYDNFIDDDIKNALKELENKTINYSLIENTNLNIIRENVLFINNINKDNNFDADKLNHIKDITTKQIKSIKDNGYRMPTYYNNRDLHCPITFINNNNGG